MEAAADLKLGFPDEKYYPLAHQERVGRVFYHCRPVPGVRAVAWGVHGIYDGGAAPCKVNLYVYPGIEGEAVMTDQRDRAIHNQGPLAIGGSPLELQMAIMHLVQLYQQTLPKEVTENEEA